MCLYSVHRSAVGPSANIPTKFLPPPPAFHFCAGLTRHTLRRALPANQYSCTSSCHGLVFGNKWLFLCLFAIRTNVLLTACLAPAECGLGKGPRFGFRASQWSRLGCTYKELLARPAGRKPSKGRRTQDSLPSKPRLLLGKQHAQWRQPAHPA